MLARRSYPENDGGLPPYRSRRDSTEQVHVPVLLKEVLQFLDLKPNDDVVDATVGAGGHARAMLERIAPRGRLLGLDLDPAALAVAREVLAPFGDRAQLVHGSFDELSSILEPTAWLPPPAILADLGLSSLTLADRQRGFSFQHHDSPLDMRFDPTSGGRTAADILNRQAAPELERILRDYGQERAARRLARSIVEQRRQHRFQTVGDLVALILAAVPRRGRIHPATKTFQALRIAVNDELGRLERFLPQAVEALAPGGKLAVISFHSLEDRIVKRFFREQARLGQLDLLTKHPATPSFAEVTTNPRSRSAKLRVAMRKT